MREHLGYAGEHSRASSPGALNVKSRIQHNLWELVNVFNPKGNVIRFDLRYLRAMQSSEPTEKLKAGTKATIVYSVNFY